MKAVLVALTFAICAIYCVSAFEAAGSAYDSLNQVCANDDNGCTQTGYRLNKDFTAHVPYAAVLCGSDWDRYKFHYVNVTYAGKTRFFEVWDCCNDHDCGGCCTKNARMFGGFLLDMSIIALRKYGWENSNCDNWGVRKIDVKFGEAFDAGKIARQYGVKNDC